MGGTCWSKRWYRHLIPIKGRAGATLSNILPNEKQYIKEILES
jgi:hypothetical protein